MPAQTMEELVALCKRRGFIFQSSDVYGGMKGVYDFGPLGVELKNNLKAAWWRSMVYERDDIEGLDAAILTHPLTLKYSGHEDTFTDPLVECKSCKQRMRADKMFDPTKCDFCGSKDLMPPRAFNLMFRTNIGPVDDGSSFAYLRPETAPGIFLNFRNVLDATSRKLPFGIAQIGKTFRNEITPRNFIFRVREFEQMELEFFVEPGTDMDWHKKWVELRWQFWLDQGLSAERLRFEVQKPEELSHYSKATTDIYYKFPHAEDELEGIANRTDFDLGSHSKEQATLNISAKVKENKHSTAKLTYSDPQAGTTVVPYVIEPSAGVDRGVAAILTEAYTEETLENGETRIVLKFKPHLAPIKVAVIPLAKNKPQLVELAKAIKDKLQKLGLGRILFENSGNVGKAYRRHDEVGTPLCVTVDFEAVEGPQAGTVTVRHRDSMAQERIAIADLPTFVRQYYAS